MCCHFAPFIFFKLLHIQYIPILLKLKELLDINIHVLERFQTLLQKQNLFFTSAKHMLRLFYQNQLLIIDILIQTWLIFLHFILVITSRVFEIPDRLFPIILAIHKLIPQVFIVSFELVLFQKLRLIKYRNHLLINFTFLLNHYTFKSQLNHYLTITLRYFVRLFEQLTHKYPKIIFLALIEILYLAILLVLLHLDKLFSYKQNNAISDQSLSLFSQNQSTNLNQLIFQYFGLFLENIQIYLFIFLDGNLMEYHSLII